MIEWGIQNPELYSAAYFVLVSVACIVVAWFAWHATFNIAGFGGVAGATTGQYMNLKSKQQKRKRPPPRHY